MKHLMLALLTIGLLAACGSSGPTQSEIRAAFEQEIPGLLELKEFKLEQARNTGSDENPVWVARVIATLAPREATYEIDTVEDGVRILKQVRAAGERINTYGTARSVRNNKGWRHSFQYDGSTDPVLGRPRSEYGADALVAGTPEADALLAEIKRKREEARIAEETRLAEEAAERKRNEEAEAAKRKRIEEAVAKYRAEFAPESLSRFQYGCDRGHIGKSYHYLVQDASPEGGGECRGTDTYMPNSNFVKCIVHAGVLARGESGVVKVTIGGSQRHFVGSPRNGINSVSAGDAYCSYQVELAEKLRVTD